MGVEGGRVRRSITPLDDVAGAVVLEPVLSRRLLFWPGELEARDEIPKLDVVDVLARMVGVVGEAGRVHPDGAVDVGAELGDGLVGVVGADAAADDELHEVQVVAELHVAHHGVEALEVILVGAGAARRKDALEAAGGEVAQALVEEVGVTDGVEGAVEDAREGQGQADELGAAGDVDSDAGAVVLLDVVPGRVGKDSKDETVTAAGVHDTEGLEVSDGALHGLELVRGVHEVAPGRELERGSDRADHNTHRDLEPLGGRGEFLGRGCETTVRVRTRGVELDAVGTPVLGLDGAGAGEDGDFKRELGWVGRHRGILMRA